MLTRIDPRVEDWAAKSVFADLALYRLEERQERAYVRFRDPPFDSAKKGPSAIRRRAEALAADARGEWAAPAPFWAASGHFERRAAAAAGWVALVLDFLTSDERYMLVCGGALPAPMFLKSEDARRRRRQKAKAHRFSRLTSRNNTENPTLALLCVAARHGSVAVLRWAVERYPRSADTGDMADIDQFTPSLLNAALRGGSIDAIRTAFDAFYEHRVPFSVDFESALCSGSLDVFRFMQAHKLVPISSVLMRYEQFNLLRVAASTGCVPLVAAMLDSCCAEMLQPEFPAPPGAFPLHIDSKMLTEPMWTFLSHRFPHACEPLTRELLKERCKTAAAYDFVRASLARAKKILIDYGSAYVGEIGPRGESWPPPDAIASTRADAEWFWSQGLLGHPLRYLQDALVCCSSGEQCDPKAHELVEWFLMNNIAQPADAAEHVACAPNLRLLKRHGLQCSQALTKNLLHMVSGEFTRVRGFELLEIAHDVGALDTRLICRLAAEAPYSVPASVLDWLDYELALNCHCPHRSHPSSSS